MKTSQKFEEDVNAHLNSPIIAQKLLTTCLTTDNKLQKLCKINSAQSQNTHPVTSKEPKRSRDNCKIQDAGQNMQQNSKTSVVSPPRVEVFAAQQGARKSFPATEQCVCMCA